MSISKDLVLLDERVTNRNMKIFNEIISTNHQNEIDE